MALGCLVTDDSRCDRVRVLDDPVSGEPVAEAASKIRVLAALQALPEEALLGDLTRTAETGTDNSQASADEQHAGESTANLRVIRTVVADAAAALHADQQLRDSFLARLPLFRLAAGGHGPAEHAWLAPNAHWQLMLRPCAGLLPTPLLASAEVQACKRPTRPWQMKPKTSDAIGVATSGSSANRIASLMLPLPLLSH